MITVEAAFNRYNANSKDDRVGDCVKRALSFAYGMDYNEVGRELNRLKSAGAAYNNLATFSKFLKNHGAEWMKSSSTGEREYKGLTEEEFSQKYNTGIYVVLSGPKDKSYSTHMCCIFNGDIIDSWNSSNYIVYDAWAVKGVDDTVTEVDWDDIEDDINAFIDTYLQQVNNKYSEWFTVNREPGYEVDRLTYNMKFILTTGDLPQESDYYPNKKYMKRVVVKINPRFDAEKNLEVLKPKLKQSVYDWLYPYQKDMRDTKAIANIQNDRFKDTYDKKMLLKLPEWIRPYVTYFWWNDRPWSSYWNSYELKFKALPDDPYVEDRGDIVRIEEENWKDFKAALDAYKKDFSRPGYDY